MAHRTFTDSKGRSWDVWTVIPERAERRRQSADAAMSLEEDRRERDDPEFRVRLADRWTHGWLCFETHGEKRRLAPIPDGWVNVEDRELERLCEDADLTTAPRRLAE